jgi:DNA invertase Pin-like site-specific DNA recombinase
MKGGFMKVVLFSRVSGKTQDYSRQTDELMEFAESMNWDVVATFQETISGAKKNSERPVLNEMLTFIQSNNVDKVLVWELSRLGRNASQVLLTIELFNKMGISLYIKNFNLETLTNREINPISQFLIEVLNSVNTMERVAITQRLRSGFQRFLSNGGKPGKKVGSKKPKQLIMAQNKDVIKLLKKGYSIRQIMVLTNKSSGLIQKVKKMLSETA